MSGEAANKQALEQMRLGREMLEAMREAKEHQAALAHAILDLTDAVDKLREELEETGKLIQGARVEIERTVEEETPPDDDGQPRRVIDAPPH